MHFVHRGERRRIGGGKEHEPRNDDGRHQRRRPDEKDEDDRHRGESVRRMEISGAKKERGALKEPCKESKPHAQNDGYGECEKRPSERIQKRTPKRFLSQRLEERGGGLRKGG